MDRRGQLRLREASLLPEAAKREAEVLLELRVLLPAQGSPKGLTFLFVCLFFNQLCFLDNF